MKKGRNNHDKGHQDDAGDRPLVGICFPIAASRYESNIGFPLPISSLKCPAFCFQLAFGEPLSGKWSILSPSFHPVGLVDVLSPHLKRFKPPLSALFAAKI